MRKDVCSEEKEVKKDQSATEVMFHTYDYRKFSLDTCEH